MARKRESPAIQFDYAYLSQSNKNKSHFIELIFISMHWNATEKSPFFPTCVRPQPVAVGLETSVEDRRRDEVDWNRGTWKVYERLIDSQNHGES